MKPCDWCAGHAWVPSEKDHFTPVDCPVCGGTGVVEDTLPRGATVRYGRTTCNGCQGAGTNPDAPGDTFDNLVCRACRGRGWRHVAAEGPALSWSWTGRLRLAVAVLLGAVVSR